MLLFLTNFTLSGSDIQRIGWDGENLTDTLTVYVDTIATGDYYLDMEDEAGNKNIIALLKDTSTHTLHVDLTKEMIGAAGMKKLQMRLCSGEETVKKSNVISVFTGASINASEPFQHTSPSEFEEVERRVSEALQQAADYGVKGDKGDKGDTGERGPQGIPGEKGETGATGPAGETGPAGPQGAAGPAGQNGQDGEDGERGFGILSVTTAPTDAGVKRAIKPSDEGVTASINDAIQYPTGDGDSYVYLVTDTDFAELKSAYSYEEWTDPNWQTLEDSHGQVYGWVSEGYDIILNPISPDLYQDPQEGDVLINDGGKSFVIIEKGYVEINGVTWHYLHVDPDKEGTSLPQLVSAPVDRYIPVATVKAEAGVDEVLVGDIIKHGDNLYKVNSVDSTNANLDEAQNIKGSTGSTGSKGDRGFGILTVTTAPTATSGTVSGKAYTYRMTGSTVRTQSGVTAVYAGDIVKHGTKLYPVVHATSSYVYMTNPTDIQGAQGPQGDDYVLTAQDKADIADIVVAEIGSADNTQY